VSDRRTRRAAPLVRRSGGPRCCAWPRAAAALQQQLALSEALTFGHSLDTQIGGQLRAGLLLTGLYEDHSQDDSWVFSKRSPVAVATRAVKPL